MDIMIDLETAGDGPDAAILSIGAVTFDLSDTISEGTEGIRETFYQNVDLRSCLDAGLTVSGSTIYWWLQQSDEARQALLSTPMELKRAIDRFRSWIDMLASVYGYQDNKFAGHVWAWPPSFDLVIFENARSRVLPDSGKFWHRRNERDARTYCAAVETIQALDPAPRYGTKHNALDDAIGQALAVRRAYAVLHRDPKEKP